MVDVDVMHWNCRGFYSKYEQVELLQQKYNPKIVCLQETYHTANKPVGMRNYAAYNTPPPQQPARAKGCAAILISKNVPHTHIAINTNLQALAVRATLHRVVTICNLYLPPSQNIDYDDLRNLVNQLPSPFLLVGDLNAHSPIWGNKNTDQKGKFVEKLLDDFNLCIFNDKTPTYFHFPTGSRTSIDLTIGSPNLVLDYKWQVCNDLYESDHYPVILQPVRPVPEPKLKRFVYQKADWEEFQKRCHLLSSDQYTVEDPITKFTSDISSIMSDTIPQTSVVTNTKVLKPWFNRSRKPTQKSP